MPDRQGHQAGEAGQAVMCWRGGVPGRQGCQAGEAARQARPVRASCAGGARGQAGEANQGVMCWGGGVPGRRGRPGRHVLGGQGARKARPVRPSCACAEGGGGGAVCLSGKAGRPPCAEGVVHLSDEASQATMCWGGGARRSGEAGRSLCA